MAAITITAANVVPSANADLRQFTAGEAITRGMPVYQKASDLLIYKAGSTTSALSTVIGVAGNDATVNQPLTVVAKDTALAYGAVLTTGQVYAVGATAGTIVPLADELSSGHYVGVIGQAVSTSTLRLDLRTPVAGALYA